MEQQEQPDRWDQWASLVRRAQPAYKHPRVRRDKLVSFLPAVIGGPYRLESLSYGWKPGVVVAAAGPPPVARVVVAADTADDYSRSTQVISSQLLLVAEGLAVPVPAAPAAAAGSAVPRLSWTVKDLFSS